MTDEEIIELFFERSEQALQELDHKYGKLCYRLSNNILNNRQDVEECVNDAYLGIWNAIPPARPMPLAAYLCKILRNISLKRYHQRTAGKRNSSYDIAIQELEGCLSSSHTVEAEWEAKELTHILEDFLDTLPRENRVIFLRRYWFSDTYANIAQHMGLTEKNVSVRLTRIRKQLKRYLTEREVLL